MLGTSMLASQALAQGAPLRGPVGENVLQAQNSGTRPNLGESANPADAAPPESGIPSRPYDPISPGALPPDVDDGNFNLRGALPDSGALPSGPADDSNNLGAQPSTPPDLLVPLPTSRPESPAVSRRGRPAVDEEATGSIPNPPIEQNREANPPAGPAERDNLPVPAIERRILRPDPEPFAPFGIRAGTVTLRPSISTGLRATTNADRSSDGKGALLSETRLRARATTDWSRHSAWLDFDGLYDTTISGDSYSAPNVALRSGFQLDLGERTTVKGEAGYRYRLEDPSAPTTITGTSNHPAVQDIDANLGVRRDFGRFFADVKANADHSIYGDAEFSDGTTVSQRDRDNTFASIALRGGFEMSPAIKPFVEVEIGKLMYDESVDADGFRRSGLRTGLRGGVELDIAEKLAGEFALGYLRQDFDDDRLNPVDGLSVDGAIKWSPQRGTDVDIGITTQFDGATDPDDSGSIFYEGRIGIKRQARANLDLKANIFASLRDNTDGTGWDKGFGAEVGATYWFNRFFGLDVSARHEFTRSEVDTREMDETSIFVGVTLQR